MPVLQRKSARPARNRADHYPDFSALLRHEREGRDYRILMRRGSSGIAVVAPHGGGIERGTSELAVALAGTEHTCYCFEGIKEKANHRLHVTSRRFDEPQALSAVGGVHKVVTIHGAFGTHVAAYGGGLDQALRQQLLDALSSAGFPALPDPSPTRQGRHPHNICNRGSSGSGVQLELTLGLRRRLFRNLRPEGRQQPTEHFHSFVRALRAVLARYEP